MRIICSVDVLVRNLKKFEPLSEFICITTNNNYVTLHAIDGLVFLSANIPCLVKTSGKVTITCKQLSKLLEVLLAKEVELVVSEDENRLQIKTVTGEYLVHTAFDVEIETIFREETSLNIEGKILLDGISGTILSASTDGTKASLCGVNLQTNGKINRFCATNAHHLSTHEIDSELSNPESNFLIINKVCGLLLKLLTQQESVNIALGKGSYTRPDTGSIVTYEAVILKFGDTVLKYSLAHIGKFPEYDQLIPRQFKLQVLVDRVSLVAAIENISVIAQYHIKFAVSRENQEIRLSYECKDVGASEVSLPATISGRGLTYIFNITYLLGGLKSFSSNEVNFSLNDALDTVIIEPLSGQKRKFLIVPVEIK